MECTVCGKEVCTHWTYLTNGIRWRCEMCGESGEGVEPSRYYVPMYEGKVVNPDNHEWDGFDACKECSEKSLSVA